MPVLQLLFLLVVTFVFFGIILLCSGGICRCSPALLSAVRDPAAIHRAARRGACPILLDAPALDPRIVHILRRSYPELILFSP